MEVYAEKMDGTLHIMHYAHDAVYRSFSLGIPVPPSTEKILQSFLKSHFNLNMIWTNGKYTSAVRFI